MSTSGRASNASGSPSRTSPQGGNLRVSINALLNPTETQPRTYSSPSYSPREAASYQRQPEYDDHQHSTLPYRAPLYQHDARYVHDYHRTASDGHVTPAASRGGGSDYFDQRRRSSSSDPSVSPVPSSTSSYREQRFPSVSSAGSSVGPNRYYSQADGELPPVHRILDLPPASQYPYQHQTHMSHHQHQTRPYARPQPGYAGPTSGPQHTRRPPRPKYNEEEMYFIWYHRVDLQQEWKDVRAKFNVQFPTRQRRGFQGIQCKYYRFTREKGCPSLRDQGRRRNSGGAPFPAPTSSSPSSTASEPESTPEYGVVQFAQVSYPWMRDEHRRPELEGANVPHRGGYDDDDDLE